MYANWNNDAWPSTNRYRFTNNVDRITVSNVYAKSWTHTAFVTNTPSAAGSNATLYGWLDGTNWNYKPAPLASNYFFGFVWAQATSIWYVATDYGIDWTVVSAGVGAPACPSNTFSATNFFLTEAKQGYTNHIGFSTTNRNTNTYFVFNSGYSNTITEIETYVGIGVQTNLKLNIKDMRAWDCYNALDERLGVIDSASATPVKYYRSERANLVSVKDTLDSNFSTFFLDTSKTNSAGNFNDYFATNQVAPYYTDVWTMLDDLGAPTNYLEYSPWRQLNGAGIPYARTVTNLWVFTGATNVLFTNQFIGYDDATHSVTGYGGTTGSVLTVNENISTNGAWSELDYGWKYMQDLFNRHIWTGNGPVDPNSGIDSQFTVPLGVTNRWTGFGLSTNPPDNYATAIARLPASMTAGGTTNSFAVPEFFVSAAEATNNPDTGTNQFSVYGFNSFSYWTNDVATGKLDFVWDIYTRPITNGYGIYYFVDRLEFDDNSEPVASNVYYLYESQDFTAGRASNVIWSGKIGAPDDTPGNAPTTPLLGGGLSFYSRGWSMGEGVGGSDSKSRVLEVFKWELEYK